MIKYRVWDKYLKTMHKVIQLDFDATEDGKPDVIYFDEKHKKPVCLHYDHCELMQYTGLKDKNGVEIYEGDICKVSDENFYEKRNMTSPVGYVCYNKNQCCFAIFLPNGSQSCFGVKEYEVLGNIHDNPEL